MSTNIDVSKLYKFDHIATRLDTLGQIDERAIQTYKSLGFLAVSEVLSSDEVQQSIDSLMNIIHSDQTGAKIQFSKPRDQCVTPEDRELAVRKVYDYVNHDELLTQIAYHPKLIEKVTEILGDEPVLVQDMALLKPPHVGGEKPWHQDMAYGPLAYDKPVIGVWIALDEAALENGCMHVIPRSHMDGGVPHYAVRDWQICDTNVRVERDVAVPLPPGGALFFHGMLHHGTPPNGSGKKRRALQLHYACKSSKKIKPDEYKRIYTNEMTDAEC